ncbi:MAG: DUF1289 domain-containing protein [Celeribacter sp.]|jgi:predicted Fe-S protein YdhL (DUF1289 family)
MSDEVWKRDEVESPCIKVCVIDPKSRLCLGCLRSINEIGAWSLMSPDERRTVMADLPARKDQVTPRRRGGRAARLRKAQD